MSVRLEKKVFEKCELGKVGLVWSFVYYNIIKLIVARFLGTRQVEYDRSRREASGPDSKRTQNSL